jgi:hypothetical protein
VPQWPSKRGLMCASVSGFFSKGVVVKVKLADGEVVCRAAVGVHLPQQIRAESLCVFLFSSFNYLSVRRAKDADD